MINKEEIAGYLPNRLPTMLQYSKFTLGRDMRRPLFLLLLLLSFSLILLPGCFGKKLQWDSPPAMSIDQEKEYTATIKTNMGDIFSKLAAELFFESYFPLMICKTQ